MNAATVAGAMSLVAARYAQCVTANYSLMVSLGELYAALWIPLDLQYGGDNDE